MAVPPHGLPEYNRMIPHGADTALLFAARVGDAASTRLLVDAGANVNDHDAWGVSAVTLAVFSGHGELHVICSTGRRSEQRQTGIHRAPLRDHAARRTDRRGAARAGRRPQRARPGVDPHTAIIGRLSLHARARGRNAVLLAARFTQPDVMRLLATHGADPKVVHESNYVQGEGYQRRNERTTAIMAGLGMGGGTAWVPIDRAERDALVLETVTVAVELGADINTASTDGRTALESARAQKYEAVAAFLEERGASSPPASAESSALSSLRPAAPSPDSPHPRGITGSEPELCRDFRGRPLRFDPGDDELALSRLQAIHRGAVARVRLFVNGVFLRLRGFGREILRQLHRHGRRVKRRISSRILLMTDCGGRPASRPRAAVRTCRAARSRSSLRPARDRLCRDGPGRGRQPPMGQRSAKEDSAEGSLRPLTDRPPGHV